jgi:hypothetical protein
VVPAVCFAALDGDDSLFADRLLDQDGTHFLADCHQFWLTVKWKNTPSGRMTQNAIQLAELRTKRLLGRTFE